MKLKTALLAVALSTITTSVFAAAPYNTLLFYNGSKLASTLKRGLICSTIKAKPTMPNTRNSIPWSTVTDFCLGSESSCQVTLYASDDCSGAPQATATFNTNTGSLKITPEPKAVQSFSHKASGTTLEIDIRNQ